MLIQTLDQLTPRDANTLPRRMLPLLAMCLAILAGGIHIEYFQAERIVSFDAFMFAGLTVLLIGFISLVTFEWRHNAQATDRFMHYLHENRFPESELAELANGPDFDSETWPLVAEYLECHHPGWEARQHRILPIARFTSEKVDYAAAWATAAIPFVMVCANLKVLQPGIIPAWAWSIWLVAIPVCGFAAAVLYRRERSGHERRTQAYREYIGKHYSREHIERTASCRSTDPVTTRELRRVLESPLEATAA